MARKPKSTLTRFADLPKADQRRIVSTISRAVTRAYGRGFYKTVHGPDQLNRRWTTAEKGGETAQLPARERNRLIALARNAARNSENFEGILHQLELNVVGCEGGKAIFSFPKGYEDAQRQISTAFARWAKSAEYFDDLNLQKVLKLVLRTLLIGGDCVLIFDYDVTSSNAGQIIAFEPDCIGNLNATDFKRFFPSYTQDQGIIKNAEGKTVGVVCSWAERGLTEYRLTDKDGTRLAWTPVKPAGMTWEECPFTIVRTVQRFNQKRGTSRFWSGLATIVDLSDYQGYEVQAAKNNAQKIATIEQTEGAESTATVESEIGDPYIDEQAGVPAAPSPSGDTQPSGDPATAPGQYADERELLELDHIEGAGTIYDLLPPGLKMTLLDTKHPNNALVEFTRYLRGGVAFAGGLGQIHSSGKSDSSYSAAMAEFIISNTEFRDQFHELEIAVLDWALANWAKMAQARGEIPTDDRLPEDWRHACVKWQRPLERVLDPVKEQSALNSGLKNGTILYRDKLGPNWKSKIDDFAEEVAYFKAKGLTHPSEITVAGAVIEANPNNTANKESEE